MDAALTRRTFLAGAAGAGRDFAVTTRLQSAKLRPGEQYYYRFLTCDRSSPVGRFRTLRPADSNQPVRIGFFSCQEWNGGYYTAHAALAEEQDLDAVVCLGDCIYERDYYNGPRNDTTGPNHDGDVQSLPEYRDKYRLYHTDSNLLRVRETHSLIATWDDHEVEDNYAGDQPGDATPNHRIPFLQRHAAAYQAFFEHMPKVRDPSAPDRVYGGVTLGRHADLLVLDQRRYRSDQPCGDPVAQPCPESEDAGRTMLGAEQKAWFLAVVEANNPHIKFGNQQYKGYGVLEARADELLVTYKAPRSVQTPTASPFTLARFHVAHGTPAVEVLGS
jgi:alkaline phosphatase D